VNLSARSGELQHRSFYHVAELRGNHARRDNDHVNLGRSQFKTQAIGPASTAYWRNTSVGFESRIASLRARAV
jgi:hypothetical protein